VGTLRIGRGRRSLAGAGLGVVLLALLTLALVPAGLSLTSVALLYLVPVVVVAGVGGVWPGLAAAAASDALLNWFFVPPFHTLAVESRDNVITLLVYVLVAVTVAVAVDLAARQREAAARSGVEARLLARMNAAPLAGQPLTHLLDSVRDTFGMSTVALLETGPDGVERVVESVGPLSPDGAQPPSHHDGRDGVAGGAVVPTTDFRPSLDPDRDFPLSASIGGLRLVADGPALWAPDRRAFARLAAAVARTLEASRQAAQAAELAEVDKLRTAILAAVGHDLRTPLAGIKAAASSLRAPDVDFSAEDRAELLATVEEGADRLDDLVENLLAMSRLQAGVLSVTARAVAVDEVVARALLHAPAGARIHVAVPDDLPHVLADPGLLERVVANLVANAVTAGGAANGAGGADGSAHGPVGSVTLRGTQVGDSVRLAVVDHGPGIPAADRERVFAPFQRLDDLRADGGLGLGLAIARGFTTAMGGTLTPTDTAGGGLTMTIILPVAP
jgi:two-component system sensor histidine kinase KdpD